MSIFNNKKFCLVSYYWKVFKLTFVRTKVLHVLQLYSGNKYEIGHPLLLGLLKSNKVNVEGKVIIKEGLN